MEAHGTSNGHHMETIKAFFPHTCHVQTALILVLHPKKCHTVVYIPYITLPHRTLAMKMLHLSPIQSAEAASIASPKLLFHFAAGEFRRDQLEFGAGERQGTAGQAATQAELNRYQFHGSDTT